jgi:hypothetical protein
MANTALPALKDELLQKLIDQPVRSQIMASESTFGIKQDILSSLIRQFDRRGLVTIQQTFGYGLHSIRVEVDADEFLLRGGFTFEEEVLKVELTKLKLEVQNLRNQVDSTTYNKLVAGIAAIAAAWTAITS